jgi:Leucine-rich repeat (LRR) protein
LLQVIENLEGLENLKCLYLGKNKITKIQNLDSLKKLETLSLQVGSIQWCGHVEGRYQLPD